MPQWILPVFIQGLGLIGLGFGVAAFQSSRHKSIVLLKLLNELVFAVQYVLLGAYTGAVMNLISCVRIISMRKVWKKGAPQRRGSLYSRELLYYPAYCHGLLH
ncbi:MAG: YgjV family protein [Oscillospiraceae bacterium]